MSIVFERFPGSVRRLPILRFPRQILWSYSPGLTSVAVHRADGGGTQCVRTEGLSKASDEWAAKLGTKTLVGCPVPSKKRLATNAQFI